MVVLLLGAVEGRAMVLFISPDGDHLVQGTSAFFDRIGYQNPDFDAGDYAVRNLGFIAITRTAEGVSNLRFRPDLLTSNALEGVFRFLAEHVMGDTEVELERYHLVTQRWISERCANRLAAQNQILSVCSLPRVA